MRNWEGGSSLFAAAVVAVQVEKGIERMVAFGLAEARSDTHQRLLVECLVLAVVAAVAAAAAALEAGVDTGNWRME